MRNIYTVMAYSTPNDDGSFTPIDPNNPTDGGASQVIKPHLGLLSLTDPTKALEEFNTVRVLNQPLSGSGGTGNGGGGSISGSNTKTVDVGGKKLSVGILVLIGLGSFVGLCGLLFGLRWFYYRQKMRKGGLAESEVMDRKSAFMLARRGSPGGGGGGVDVGLSKDVLREMRYREYMQKSGSTMSSDQTQVDRQGGLGKEPGGDEFGMRSSARNLGAGGEEDDEWNPNTGRSLGWGNTNTLVGGTTRNPLTRPPGMEVLPLVADQDRHTPPSSPDMPIFPHHRHDSEVEEIAASHRQNLSLSESHHQNHSPP
ncbi:hypothetical protein B0H34DRAFT_158668 [Crassisporium funariophilum]|nr:hypothetical protein B0H34DRAFT_158668 [Crassisporium funariophilum]